MSDEYDGTKIPQEETQEEPKKETKETIKVNDELSYEETITQQDKAMEDEIDW